jgi:hypothetical protein
MVAGGIASRLIRLRKTPAYGLVRPSRDVLGLRARTGQRRSTPVRFEDFAAASF